MRGRDGEAESFIERDEQTRKNGLYTCSGGSLHVSGHSSDAIEQGGFKPSVCRYDNVIPNEIAATGVVSIASLMNEDMVNHPPHYSSDGVECIEAIEAQLTKEEYRGYLKGNVAKYLWREKHKGGIESLKKAQWYLTRLIDIN